MKDEFRTRWNSEYKKLRGRLKKPQDLLDRAMSSEDFVDTAILGGYAVSDIVEGKIQELQIPGDVRSAFHAQYPNIHSSLVDEVQKLHQDPDSLRGLISGVKGKLFEQHYVGYLNDHLPVGMHAELAEHANNPAWDIAIKDAHGHINQVLQAKVSSMLGYVRHAVDSHPDIDVVVPHDAYQHLSALHDLAPHLIDDHGDTVAGLTTHATEAVAHASHAANLLDNAHFHLPVIGVLFACGQNFVRYRSGRCTVEEAVKNATERSVVSLAVSGAVWAGIAVTGHTIVGLPIAIVLRQYYTHWKHSAAFNDRLKKSTSVVVAATRALSSRPALALPAPA